MKKVKVLTTPTCLKCKLAMPRILTMCEETGTECEIIDAMTEGIEYVKEFNILTVPAVLIIGDTTKVLTGDINFTELYRLLSGV